MKTFEVEETLVLDEKTGNVSVWVVKDIHSGKTVFFVKDNEVLIADEDYMKTLMGLMKVPLITENDDDDENICKGCYNDDGCRCDGRYFY